MSRRPRSLGDVFFVPAIGLVGVLAICATVWPSLAKVQYVAAPIETVATVTAPAIVHVETPVPVKAVYMSQCLAADKGLRQRIVDLVNETELNSIIIDIKDYSGGISFPSTHPLLAGKTSKTCYVSDFPEFIKALHRDGMYVIGRITVFQDPQMSKMHPELAIKRASDHMKVWTDRKGISYIDPGAKDMWTYIIALSLESYDTIGFDELNFDYIRFPSDGDMTDIYFPFSESVIDADPRGGKTSVMREFFAYLSREMRARHIPTSADVFGMTTTNTDDLNIGQVLESILPYFDYVAPMVYPSHYPPNFIGLPNPAAAPYEVVKYSLDRAVLRANTTPWKLRPWLQDFTLGAVYTPEMVRAQMQATYDSGLTSWMLWNASNHYTREALDTN